MAKILQVEMSDGSKWNIPALIISRDRASYYAEQDTGKTSGAVYDEVYQREYTYAMEHVYELIDWASNNMNWEDVQQHALRVQEPITINLSEEWSNADKIVIET